MTNYAASIRNRLNRRSLLEQTPQFQPLELAKCRRDPSHWVNAWCWTYDPRLAAPVVPFDLFFKQAQFLAWLAERECAAGGRAGREEPGHGRDIPVLARRAASLAVPAPLLGRVRQPQAGTGGPPRRPRFDFREVSASCSTVCRSGCFQTGSTTASADNHVFGSSTRTRLATITGEGGDEIGRGGRKSAYFIDEAAFLERPESVDRALSQTTNVRIDVSTPNGQGESVFHDAPFGQARRCSPFTGATTRGRARRGMRIRSRRCDPVTLAQEVDIDYAASLEGICIPAAWSAPRSACRCPRAFPLSPAWTWAGRGRRSPC